LNSGPGSVGGCFIHERHAEAYDLPRFAGWWGHDKETRFGMRDDFKPIPGAEGWQLSNPPILSLAAIRASLDIFDEVGMEALHKKSIKLTGYLESLLTEDLASEVEIITPKNLEERGCQLSLQLISGNGKKIFEAITRRGVIADWREPNVIRIAPAPLYNSFEDVFKFVSILKEELQR
jgi:kynureninase